MSKKVFFIGVFIILFIPLLSKLDVMILGTYEPVISSGNSIISEVEEDDELFGVTGNIWHTVDDSFRFKGVFDINYLVGEKRMAFVNRNHISDSFVFDFPNIFLGSNGAICLVLLVFWYSVYYSYKDKGYAKEKRNSKIETFKTQLYKKLNK